MKICKKFWGLQGIRYKLRQKDFCILCIMFAVMGLVEYFRAVNTGMPPEHSFFDIFLWNQGNALNLTFVQTVCYLVALSGMLIHGSEDVPFILHKKSRKNIWSINISTIFILTVVWALISVIMAFLLSVNTDMGSTEPSLFIQDNFKKLSLRKADNVGEIAVQLLGNGICYFFCVGLVYYLFLLLARKRNGALICSFAFMTLEYAVYLGRLDSIAGFTMLGHVILGYSEGSLNTRVSLTYWGTAVLTLCLASRHITGKTDVEASYPIQAGVVFYALKNTLWYQFRKKIVFFLGTGILYFCLAVRYIGYSQKGFGETAALYFSGSDRLDARFLLWIFLELCITLYSTWFLWVSLKYNVYNRMLPMKNRKHYFDYLAGMLAGYAVFFSAAVIGTVGLLLSIRREGMYVNARLTLYDGESYLFYLMNYMTGLILFSFWVGILSRYTKSLAQSYVIILVLQFTSMTLYIFFGGPMKWLPLLHGYASFYSAEFTWKFALAYQAAEGALAFLIWRRLGKSRFVLTQEE